MTVKDTIPISDNLSKPQQLKQKRSVAAHGCISWQDHLALSHMSNFRWLLRAGAVMQLVLFLIQLLPLLLRKFQS